VCPKMNMVGAWTHFAQTGQTRQRSDLVAYCI